MPVVELTPAALKQIFPKAPQKYIDGLIAQKDALDRAGITTTRTRLAYCLSNVEHECGGFTIPNLTENINYTPGRAAQVWPNRFRSASDVRARFGEGPGWQLKMFDVVYGNRMGNRPGTHDGSHFIGRGACQHTGRDGYAEMQKRSGVPCVDKPELASEANNQAPLIAAFWSWKALNSLADAGNFSGVVKRWNGGTNGMADRLNRMAGNDPVIKKLAFVAAAAPILKALPGGPLSPHQPPQAAVDNATANERKARAGGATSTVAGGAGEATKAGTQQPDVPALSVLSPMITYTLIAGGIVVFIVAAILIARKVKAVKENWV